jgi:HlyD family secretion protein
VFRVDGSRARLTAVEVGQRNADEAQIVKGLEAGTTVVRYSSNDIPEGTRVKPCEVRYR